MSVAARTLQHRHEGSVAGWQASSTLWPKWPLLTAGCTAAFLIELVLVLHGGGPLDNGVISRALHVSGHGVGYAACTAISVVFGSTVLPVLVALLSAVLWLRGQVAQAARVFLTVAGAGFLDCVVRAAVARPDPHFFARAAHVGGSAFPSNHAASAAALTGVLLCMLWPALRRHGRIAAYGMAALALVVPLLVGLARVALGVHYPGDVVGGYALGGAWLGLVSAVYAHARPECKRRTHAWEQLPPVATAATLFSR